MPKVPVYNMDGQQTGELELSDQVFAAQINEPLMHQAVRMQLAGRRRGTAATKTRGLVRGGGRKPWRQKGTGRARHGSIRSPLWVGGGTVFGPQPRDYGFVLPKKARRAALRSALSAKVRDGELKIVEDLDFSEPKTRRMQNLLNNLKVNDRTLVVTGEEDKNVYLSIRNIPGSGSLVARNLNVYDVLDHKYVVMTRDAVGVLEGALSNGTA